MTGLQFGVIMFCLFMAALDRLHKQHTWSWIWFSIALLNWSAWSGWQ